VILIAHGDLIELADRNWSVALMWGNRWRVAYARSGRMRMWHFGPLCLGIAIGAPQP
jgi:hypothetical protein